MRLLKPVALAALLGQTAPALLAQNPTPARPPQTAPFATLTFAGLRIGELLDLRWGAVDLAADRIRVGHMKTDAGVRDVTIRPVLRDLLAALKASAPDACPRAYVFGTETGQRQTAGNGVDACSRRPSAGPTSGSRRRGADRGELLAAPLLSAVALGRHRTDPLPVAPRAMVCAIATWPPSPS